MADPQTEEYTLEEAAAIIETAIDRKKSEIECLRKRANRLKKEDKATEERFERSVVEYVDRYFDHKAMPKMWLDQLLWDTRDTVEDRLPEMSIAAWIAGGVCANLLYKLACGKFVKFFPNFYFYSAKDDMN